MQRRRVNRSIRDILDDVSRLTIELTAYRVEGGEAKALHLPRLEEREGCQRQPDSTRQLGEGHLSPGKHHIQIYLNRHDISIQVYFNLSSEYYK